MPVSYDLGTAQGKVVIDFDDTGVKKASTGLGTLDESAKKASKSAGDVPAALKKVSSAALVAGAAVAGAFAVAIKTAADFEKRLSAIQAVSGATADEMDLISTAALRIGKDTVFSASEAGLAMEELLKSGISVTDVLNGAADATVALAAAGEIDLPQAASIASAAMNQFKLSARDLTDVADLMAGAANASATGVSEIGMALSFVGPVAAAAGLSINDTAAAIAILANNGIDGMKAGTGLRAILAQLQPSSKQAAAAMKELGLITEDGTNAFYEADGSLKDLRSIVSILGDAFGDLTEQQKIAYGTTIFGRDSLAAINAVAATSTEQFDELVTSIKSVSAADVAATRLNNLYGQLEQLQGGLETAAIMIGQTFIPMVTDMVLSLVDALDWFISLDEGTRNLILTIAALTGGLLLAFGIIVKVTTAVAEFQRALVTLGIVSNITKAFQTLRFGLTDFIAGLLSASAANSVFTGTMGTLGGAVAIASARLKAFTLALIKNPITLVVVAIASLIAAIITLYQTSEEFRQLFVPLFESAKRVAEQLQPSLQKIGEAFMGLVDTLVTALVPILTTLVEAILPVVEILMNVLGPVLELVATILAAVLGPVLMIVGKLLEALAPIIMILLDALTPLINLLVDLLGPALEFIGWILGIVADALQVAADWVKDFFKETDDGTSQATDAWDAFVSFLTDAWQAVVDFLSPIIDTIVGFFEGAAKIVTDAWNGVVGFFTGIVDGIVAAFQFWLTVVRNVINGIRSFVAPIIAWFMEHVVPVFVAFSELVSKAFNYLLSVVSYVWNMIVMAITTAVNAIVAFVTPIIEFLVTAVVAYFTQIWETLVFIWDAIVAAVTTAVQAVVDFITAVWGAILGFITPIFNAVWNFVSGIFQKVYSFISGIVNDVVSTITDVWNGLIATVTDIFTNVFNAIKEPLDGVMDFFDDLYNDIVDFFSDAGQWLLDAGGNIIDGLIAGIEGALGGLTDLLTGVTESIPEEKGPPEKDKVLLERSGGLIMQGLIAGIREEIPELMALLGGITLGIPSDMQANITAAMGPKAGDSRTFNYYAAPGSEQLSGQDELFVGMKRSKVVVPGWG